MMNYFFSKNQRQEMKWQINKIPKIGKATLSNPPEPLKNWFKYLDK